MTQTKQLTKEEVERLIDAVAYPSELTLRHQEEVLEPLTVIFSEIKRLSANDDWESRDKINQMADAAVDRLSYRSGDFDAFARKHQREVSRPCHSQLTVTQRGGLCLQHSPPLLHTGDSHKETNPQRTPVATHAPPHASSQKGPAMNDPDKKLEACGDGLLLACARLYLKERHPGIPYSRWTRLTALLVNNRTLARIAEGEGIRAGKESADELEKEIARRFYREGFGGVRAWLWSLFDRHVDIAEEARKMLDPDEQDALVRAVRGALRCTLKQGSGPITEQSIEQAAKQIVAHLAQRAA